MSMNGRPGALRQLRRAKGYRRAETACRAAEAAPLISARSAALQVQLTRDLTSAICRSCGAIMPAEAA